MTNKHIKLIHISPILMRPKKIILFPVKGQSENNRHTDPAANILFFAVIFSNIYRIPWADFVLLSLPRSAEEFRVSTFGKRSSANLVNLTACYIVVVTCSVIGRFQLSSNHIIATISRLHDP